MLTRSCLGTLGFAVLLAAATEARAQDANTEAAQIHYKAGEQYYVRGLYGQAIAEFREAYRLSKAPALLYNMSQAYERAGDLPAAREHLKRYMDSGDADASELPALREKLDSLDRRIGDGKKPQAPPPPQPPQSKTTTPPPMATAAPAAVAPRPVVDEGPRRPFKTWKWVAGGTGAGFLALSALFALDAKKQEQDIEDAAGGNPPPVWTPELMDKYDRGKRANSMAIVLGVSGVALAATGVVLFVLDARSREEPRAAVVPLLAPGSAGAAAIVRF